MILASILQLRVVLQSGYRTFSPPLSLRDSRNSYVLLVIYLIKLNVSLQGFKSGKLVHCHTEKEVFDVLGFPWLEPHERNL